VATLSAALMAGSALEVFRPRPEEQRWQLVEYLKTL
jgi:hypothetical protein